jgi:hypothetical protein
LCLGLWILSPVGEADELPAGFSLVPISATGNHAIEGHEIVLMGSGQDVTFEIYLRGWYPNPQDDPFLSAHQATIDASGFITALNGYLDLAYTTCQTDSDCPSDEWSTPGQCQEGLCNLPSALYVDKLHPDYVFAGVDALWVLFDYYDSWAVASTVLDLADAVSDPGVAKYAGTLVLRVSPGAEGTFTVGFVDDSSITLFLGTNGVPIPVPGVTPALITVHADCNENGLPDDQDIASGTSADCTSNGVPDECEPDCNDNGIADSCDLANQTSFDCNLNNVLDECDMSAGTSDDCDASGVPDDCEYGWVAQGKLTASDGVTNHSFGMGVALSGGVAVVGAHQDNHAGFLSGAAYVFRWDGTSWIQEAKLTASDAAEEDHFGRSVGANGDTIIAGASVDDDMGYGSGSAYVYRWREGDWIEEAKLTASDGEAYDAFGYSVSINGERAVVGTPLDDDVATKSGSVYVFRRNDGGTPGNSTDYFWLETHKLTASDGAADDMLGGSVSISGTRLAAGRRQPYEGIEDARAYVFRLDDNGTPLDYVDDFWVEEGRVSPLGTPGFDWFGSSVSIFGDRMAVGAPHDAEAGDRSGAAYVFRRDDADTPGDPSDDFWRQEARLIASDASQGDYFGYSVSISAGWVAVGASLNDEEEPYAGAAYMFRLNDNGTPGDPADDFWVEEAKITAWDAGANDYFGRAVSNSGNDVLVGAWGADDLGASSGAAYVFNRLGELPDGDEDSVPDACDNCDLFNPDQLDCQLNGIGDVCDIDSGTSEDVNADGVPDECEHPVEAPAPHDAPKNRYISFAPGTTYAVALQVTLAASEYFPGDVGLVRWVDAPEEMCLLDECSFVSRLSDTPVFRSWAEPVVHIGDCEIVPAATYEIRATPDGVVLTNPFEVATIHKPGSRYYGDVVGIGTGDLPPEPGFTPPNRVVNVSDVQALLLTVQGPTTPSVHTTWVDLHGLDPGTVPNYILNVSDLQRIIFGFEGQTYTETPGQLNPAGCP